MISEDRRFDVILAMKVVSDVCHIFFPFVLSPFEKLIDSLFFLLFR